MRQDLLASQPDRALDQLGRHAARRDAQRQVGDASGYVASIQPQLFVAVGVASGPMRLAIHLTETSVTQHFDAACGSQTKYAVP